MLKARIKRELPVFSKRIFFILSISILICAFSLYFKALPISDLARKGPAASLLSLTCRDACCFPDKTPLFQATSMLPKRGVFIRLLR
jgi:hypothetical protein